MATSTGVHVGRWSYGQSASAAVRPLDRGGLPPASPTPHTEVPVRVAVPTPRPRRSLLVIALALLALVASLVPTLPAAAEVTTPVAGEVVSGIVPIHENRGGNNGSSTLGGGCSGAYTRIEVLRVSDGVTLQPPVFEQTRANPVAGGGNDPFTYEWDSRGELNGTYRIRSITSDRTGSLFSCSGSNAAEVVRSDLSVTLENLIGGALRVPATHVTGEPLPVRLTSQDPTGAPIGGQAVEVEVAGVETRTVTTDGDGEAELTVELPDLPAGPLTLTATTVSDDPAFGGTTTSATTQLLARPTTTTWTGDVRGFPGDATTLQARVTDATPDSDRYGEPIGGVEVTLAFEQDAATVPTDADGRATRTVTVDGGPRQAVASAAVAGTEVYAPGVRSITYLVGDDAAAPSATAHGLVGGLTRLVGTVLTNPSSAVGTVTGYLDSLLTPVGLDLPAIPDLPLQELDAVLEDTLGSVATEVGRLGDLVDDLLDTLVEELPLGPETYELLETLSLDWQSVYVTPTGERVRRTFTATIGVPEPLDVTGDDRADVVANLTLRPGGSAELPVTPVLRVEKLGNAPAELPLSLQAVIGGGFIRIGGDDGRLRFGFDTRDSSAPDTFRADLGLGDGAFDIDVRSTGGRDLAVSGALEGDGLAVPLGAGAPSLDAPSFDDPATASEVGDGETRFAIGFSPAPRRARIGLALGGGEGDLGVTFDTDAPTVIGVDLVQDSGRDEVTLLGAVFDAVDGPLALTLDADANGGDSVAPDLGLQLLSDAGLDRLAVQSRSLADGQVTDDLLLSLTDVPEQVTFGLGDDGALALTASAPIGVLEAGFATGGAIATLDEPAFLYVTTEDDFQSVGLRLLGVTSLLVDLGDNLGLELDMAPGPLRALVDSGSTGLDARIYDAPQQLSLGLAADGAFLVDPSGPIDLITLTVSDSSGILMGATAIEARIEDIRSRLSVGLGGEGVTFDAGDRPVGLLDLFATSGPAPSLPDDQDGLVLNLGDDAFVLGARIHGLRNISADLDLESGTPSFAIDTVSEAVFHLDLALDDLAISGVIDHLVPGMRMGIASDDEGNLAGLVYEGSRATNSLAFDIPGFASFTAANPLPARLEMGVGTGISLAASEEFTLQLQAEVGDIEANINDLRARVMDFGAGDLGGEFIPFEVNTTEWNDDCPDGCTYPIPSGTVRLGPIPLGGLNAFVNFTPGGIAARDATVFMELDDSGLIPAARHVETVGELFCTPQTNLAASVRIIIDITIQMRDALCGGATTEATVTANLDAPPAVRTGTDVVHTLTARNAGPTPATGVRIEATHDGALGDPGIACPGGGAVTEPDEGTVVCTWNGTTALNATRVMTLTWPTDGVDDGTALHARYLATSDTAGRVGTAEATTVVADEVAILGLLSIDAPGQVVAGFEAIQHRVDIRNDGPSTAQDVRVDASYNDDLGTPTVTCSEGGTPDGDACLWAGATDVDGERWAAFVWAAPDGSGGTVLDAEYVVTSATAGGGATARAATSVAAERADLTIVSSDATGRALPGETVRHEVVVGNTGPSAATALRLLADHDPVAGPPEVSCSDGGVASVLAEIDRARCVWLGATPAGAERTMVLTWELDDDLALGSRLAVRHRATSDTAGADASTTTRTDVAAPVAADLDVTAVSAPEQWAPGANLVHRVEITNTGPEPAADVEVLAGYTEAFGTPTVTCSTGGTATSRVDDEPVGRCRWAGSTAAGVVRTVTVTWPNAQVTGAWNDRDPDGDAPRVEVAFTASSTTPGTVASAETVTELTGAVADLAVTGGTAPATVLRGTQLVHSANVARSGPSAATDLTVTGTYDPDLPAPNVTCSSGASGGVVTPDPETPNVRTCTWPSTTGTTARTMTFTWPAATTADAAFAPGTAVESHFAGTSATPSNSTAAVTRRTEVTAPTARPSIQGVTGPAQVTLGEGTLVQRIDARNDGPQALDPMVLLAAHDGRLGAPTVACSTGGTPTAAVDGEPLARCRWGSTTAGTARTMTLTWPLPAEAEPGAFGVTWTATGTVPNGSAEDATHVSSVQLRAPDATDGG
ncbi:hypothetical protein FTX61_00285 [Nitriliruptoraceae bacterium ZYF776]|nr:hypothetical protein [Profundirhabdus halotolerans]